GAGAPARGEHDQARALEEIVERRDQLASGSRRRVPLGVLEPELGLSVDPAAVARKIQDVVAVTHLVDQPLEGYLAFGVQVGGRDVAEAPLDADLLGLDVDRRELATTGPRRPALHAVLRDIVGIGNDRQRAEVAARSQADLLEVLAGQIAGEEDAIAGSELG